MVAPQLSPEASTINVTLSPLVSRLSQHWVEAEHASSGNSIDITLDLDGVVPPGEVGIRPQIDLMAPGRAMLRSEMEIGLSHLLRQ